MPKGICPPETEVAGISVRAFVESINHKEFRPILEKYGFADGIDDKKWYSLKDVLEALNEIAEAPGGMFNLVSIGMAAADISMTPEMQQLSLGEFLAAYSEMWPVRHRNGTAGTLTSKYLEEKHVILTLDVYYPDDLMYGVFYGFARCLLPEGVGFTIKYDENHLRRDEGGETTIIHVMWD